jgi:hypothetical protein
MPVLVRVRRRVEPCLSVASQSSSVLARVRPRKVRLPAGRQCDRENVVVRIRRVLVLRECGLRLEVVRALRRHHRRRASVRRDAQRDLDNAMLLRVA